MSQRTRICAAATFLLAALALLSLRTWQFWVSESRFWGKIPAGRAPVVAESFVPAGRAVHLRDDELVVGIAMEGRAKAYPIRFLAFLDHANDQIGQHPICATW